MTETVLSRYERPEPFIITELSGIASVQTIQHFIRWWYEQPEVAILGTPVTAMGLLFPCESIVRLNTIYLTWLQTQEIWPNGPR